MKMSAHIRMKGREGEEENGKEKGKLLSGFLGQGVFFFVFFFLKQKWGGGYQSYFTSFSSSQMDGWMTGAA